MTPWEGLWALLMSPSKGLFVYSPAVVLGLLTWWKLHRAFPRLSWILIAAIVFRWIFIASRSDWHGGFSLGPRYYLMVIPLCLLPLAFWLKEELERPRLLRLTALSGLLFVLICEQVYFCVGEALSSYYLLDFYSNNHGINPFKNDQIYISAQFAPIIHLFEGWRGPVF